MTQDEAIQFLEQHQPLPPDSELEEALIVQFDEIRKFFAANPNPSCVSLLLNSFGNGSGFGVYQLVEGTLQKQDKSIVVEELKSSLQSPNQSIRNWSAEIAAGFPHEDLVEPLVALLGEDDFDIKYAALTALEQAREFVRKEAITSYAQGEQDEELRELAEQIAESFD